MAPCASLTRSPLLRTGRRGTVRALGHQPAGFSGELDDIAANGNNAPEIVTVGKKDAGFETQG